MLKKNIEENSAIGVSNASNFPLQENCLAKKVMGLTVKMVGLVNLSLKRTKPAVMIFTILLLAGCLSCNSDNNGNTSENGDFSGLVDIGNGRKMYLECLVSGFPTVVFIAGGHEAGWISKYALYSTDLIQDEPTNAFGEGRGDIQKLERAVFPTAGKLTRVCNYDRPNTTIGDNIEFESGG